MTQDSAIFAKDITEFCDEYLAAASFQDYCPNGLQVDAGAEIKRIVTGVTASEALIDAAIQDGADAILVHHGYFWKGEPAPITGMKGKRIRKLMQHGISLIAYHLPLDAHTEIGNNAVLARELGLIITGALYPTETRPVGNVATCPPQSSAELCQTIETVLGRKLLYISGNRGDNLITRVGICTGGAQDMIEQAAAMGCDAYISGEISERTTHSARELGIDYFACGHHATERGGIQALGEMVREHFGIPVTFIDIDNPA